MTMSYANAARQSARLRCNSAQYALACVVVMGCAHAATPAATRAQTPSRTQLIILGTGTPIPDPDRSGPAVAIVVDSTAYLFDAGTGVVRRAAAAARMGVTALQAPNLGILFLTHLHSDHTLGLNDVMFTPWIQRRALPLELYGPPGTARLANSIVDGNSEDIAERLASSAGPVAGAYRANVHEISEGVVYSDARVSVRAFAVPHSRWQYAFGYRIQTPDKVIVLSGDARTNAAIARECNGCDILVHEVYSDAGFKTIPPLRQVYHANAHTSATQLGDIATAARPRLLVLYHQLFFGASDSTLTAEVRSRFSGRVVSAKDLDRF
jgi:ribonuclease BN (tRNA processing enzyme)